MSHRYNFTVHDTETNKLVHVGRIQNPKNSSKAFLRAFHLIIRGSKIVGSKMTAEELDEGLMLILAEFSPVLNSDDPSKYFEEYKLSLSKKPFEKLGVNV